MVKLTNRYCAHEFDVLHDGWKIGLGRDLRLEREVILAVLAVPAAQRESAERWLAERAAISHPYVAELLDGAWLDTELICVFEGGAASQIGLPNLGAPMLLSAFLQIVEGLDVLFTDGAPFRFSAGEVLWDRKKAKLLGLFCLDAETAPTESSQAAQVAQYFGHALNWLVWSNQESTGRTLSPIWGTGLARLLGQNVEPCTAFSDVSVIVHAMMADDDWLRTDEVLSGTTSPLPEVPIAPDRARSSLSESGGLLQSVESRFRHRRIGSAAAVVASLAVLVLGGGSLYLKWTSDQNAAGGQPTSSATSSGAIQRHGSQPRHAGLPHTAGTLPDVTGRTPSAALKALAEVGVVRSEVQVLSVHQQGVPGLVAASSPAAGSEFHVGQPVYVDVVVPAGENLVPNLIGLTQSQAQRVLEHSALHYSFTLHRAVGVRTGLVYQQSPAPYALDAQSAPVQFQVAAAY